MRRSVEGDHVTVASRFGASSFFAMVSRLAARSAAACALLRPSATASAKFANSTVNHSQSVTARMKPAGASPWPPSACTQRIVVRMLPMYTTNITGFLHWCCGSSFTNESTSAS